MKIHYFHKKPSDNGFYHIELKAFLEEKEFSRLGEKRLSFKYLEKLRLCVSKDLQFCDCKHEFGRDNCIAHFAHSRKELTKDLGKWEFYPLIVETTRGLEKWH